MIPFKKIALIGTGNVSYAFYKALINNGIYPDCVYTRDVEKISETERHFGIKAISDFKLVMDSDLIIIAVKDDVIKEVSLNLNGFKGLLVHTSGTQSSSLLNNVENYGILYPLQTLTKGFDVDFKKIPLLVNASSSEYLIKLKSFASVLTDVVVECSDDDRSHIHMSAVYVSNFVNVMLQIGNKLLQKKNLDISLLEPLIRETIRKSFVLGPEKALTGPAKRADFETISKHKSMLSNDIEEKKIYELLTNYILNKYK